MHYILEHYQESMSQFELNYRLLHLSTVQGFMFYPVLLTIVRITGR